MASVRSGRAPNPNSRKSLINGREFVELPEKYSGAVPDFPFMDHSKREIALWDELWAYPQALMWAQKNLKFQVAAYVRAFLESVEPGASAGLKTAVLRMESELGLSMKGMLENGWLIPEAGSSRSAGRKPAARKARSADWLKVVEVEQDSAS